MQWIDQKYIGALAPRLSMFSQKDSQVWNMRCPLCGDSRKSKTKARGYILGKNGGFVYVCHNCNVSLPFGRFLQSVDPLLYKEYVSETFIERNSNTANIVEPAPDISKFITPKFIKFTALNALKRISQLEDNHPAKKYVVSRKIPSRLHYKLFYAPKFKKWTNTLVPDKFDLTKADEPRLIIPFVDQKGNLFGYQGRSFFNRDPKYITIILDQQSPKIYGLDSVNMNDRVYVVEGPIDSMFVANSLAMAGAHLDKTVAEIGLKIDNTVVIYDNEPRNANIVSAIEKVIDKGYKVCVWPEHMTHKDINEMVQNGYTEKQVKQLIDDHTYSDLMAKVMLTKWRKV